MVHTFQAGNSGLLASCRASVQASQSRSWVLIRGAKKHPSTLSLTQRRLGEEQVEYDLVWVRTAGALSACKNFIDVDQYTCPAFNTKSLEL